MRRSPTSTGTAGLTCSSPDTPIRTTRFPNSLAGFPTNLAGGAGSALPQRGQRRRRRARFREVGVQAGLESATPRHGLGAVFTDYNGDGRPDLYVANDEDPNQLYKNVPWPGGPAADPAGLGFRFEERAARPRRRRPLCRHGHRDARGANGRRGLFVTNSRNEPSAAFRAVGGVASPAFANARPTFDPALGSDFAGWGASWVDLSNSRHAHLVLAAGAIPVTKPHERRRAGPRARPGDGARDAARFGDAAGVFGAGALRLNGRGLAAADVNNNGRMEIAINTIGGKLAAAPPHRPDRPLARRRAVEVLARARSSRSSCPTAQRLVARGAGREQLPLVRGSARALRARQGDEGRAVTVRYPWGGESRVRRRPRRPDRQASPCRQPCRRTRVEPRPPLAGELHACGDRRTVGRRVLGQRGGRRAQGGQRAEPMRRATSSTFGRDVGRLGCVRPEGARLLRTEKAHATDLQSARDAAISYAAYRLLVWRASFNANLDTTFALLTKQLRGALLLAGFHEQPPATRRLRSGTASPLPRSPYGRTTARGRRSTTPTRVHAGERSHSSSSQPGSTVHDATFWQPLALARARAGRRRPR